MTGNPLTQLTVSDFSADAAHPGVMIVALVETLGCTHCGHTGTHWLIRVADTADTKTTDTRTTNQAPRRMATDPGC